MKKKKIFAITTLLLLFVFLFAHTVIFRPGITIEDEDPALGAVGSVEVNFYKYDSANVNWFTFLIRGTSLFEYVGSGVITNSGTIYSDAAAVQEAIISEPDTNGEYIEWNSIVKYYGKYVVLGTPVEAPVEEEEEADTETSDEVPEEIAEEQIDFPTEDIAETNDTTEIEEIIEPKNYVLTRDQLLSAVSNDFNEGDTVKWESFSSSGRDVADGIIPIELLDDPVYTSMNFPSESRSDYMIKAWRDNAHIIGDTSSPNAKKMVAIGSIYQTSGTTLPDKITLCIGKIKLFAYSEAEQQWVVLSEDSAPRDAMIYKIPWSSGVIKIDSSNKVYYDDHLEITVNGSDLTGNTLHFWGTKVPFDKTLYKYYACAYTFWVKDPSYSGLCTSCVAIDIKADTGTNTICQLMSSRGMSVEGFPKDNWGTTIPNNEYNPSFGIDLQNLFNQ